MHSKRCIHFSLVHDQHTGCEPDRGLVFLLGSLWEVVGDVYRVTQCRAGFVIVRGSRAEADHCFPCPVNRYLADTAKYYVTPGEPWLVATTAEEAALMCRASEPGLLCMGGDSVLTQEGFWRLDRPVRVRRTHVTEEDLTSERRFVDTPAYGLDAQSYVQPSAFRVFRCAVGVCLNNGTCAYGRHGPVCGLCLPGFLHSRSGCIQCSDPEGFERARPVAIAVIVIFSLIVWFLTTWWPLFFETRLASAISQLVPTGIYWRRRRVMPANNEPYNTWPGATKPMSTLSLGASVYIKNGVGFFQLIASLGITFYDVDWGNMALILSGANIFSFEIFSFPDIACLTGGLSFTATLIIVTAVPGGVCLLLGIPSAVTMVMGHMFCGGWSKHPRQMAVLASFYYWVNIWLFIMYLPASMVCLSAFHCRWYGDDWLLVSDMREVLAWEYASVFTCVLSGLFVRACICLLLSVT